MCIYICYVTVHFISGMTESPKVQISFLLVTKIMNQRHLDVDEDKLRGL